MKRVVLVGGGHAHLHVVSGAEAFRDVGAELCLVDPGSLWYSGMATGMLSGRYTPEEDRINLEQLSKHFGVTFHQARAVSLQSEERSLELDSGETLTYDLVSLNVGSSVARHYIDDPDGLAWTVKPIPNLLALKKRIEEHVANNSAIRIAVIGGGPTGCEVAANIEALVRHLGGKVEVTVFQRGEVLLPNFPRRAASKLASCLSRRGIQLQFGNTVEAIVKAEDSVGVRTGSGEEFEFDEVVLATGLVASESVESLGLGVDGLAVDGTLSALDREDFFGAGDCIAFVSQQLPKVGVFGVRQAPILQSNLLATIRGEQLTEYIPQKEFLIILNLGDGTGLAIRGGWWWYGKLAFLLKNLIDKRFMRKYQSL